jgi:3-phenylpropionate/trans-cinnamate dioxygenase ferredoxin subunit
VSEVEVGPLEELPPGSMRLVELGSHDDGPLCEGEWEPEACIVVCPRHGSRFDLESGIPMTLPAFAAVATYPVSVRAGTVVVEVPD